MVLRLACFCCADDTFCMTENLALAQRNALTAVHQFLTVAQAAPTDSDIRQDCLGVAEDVMLALEAYSHLWRKEGTA